MDSTDTDTVATDKETRLRAWRGQRFEALGFSPAEAFRLAEWGVDAHDAEALLKRGCAHLTAVRILCPLSAKLPTLAECEGLTHE